MEVVNNTRKRVKKLKDMFFSGKDVMSFSCIVTWIARLMVLHMAILGRTLAAYRNVLGEVVTGVGYTDFPCSDGLLGTCIGRNFFGQQEDRLISSRGI